MKTNLYAIRVQADYLVAAEVADATAATLFDAGHTILLATEPDLARLARRLNRSLAIFSRNAQNASPARHGNGSGRKGLPSGDGSAADRLPGKAVAGRRPARGIFSLGRALGRGWQRLLQGAAQPAPLAGVHAD